MPRKKPEPNYDLMLKSAITALQMDYAEWKKAFKEDLEFSWYADDGSFCRLEGHKDRLRRLRDIQDRIDIDKAQILAIRTQKAMMEGAEDAGREH